jgi:hypothetical protein
VMDTLDERIKGNWQVWTEDEMQALAIRLKEFTE